MRRNVIAKKDKVVQQVDQRGNSTDIEVLFTQISCGIYFDTILPVYFDKRKFGSHI